MLRERMSTSIMLCSKNMEDRVVAIHSKPMVTTIKYTTFILRNSQRLYNSAHTVYSWRNTSSS